MTDLEIIKNAFALFGIICFSTLVISQVVRLIDLVKIHRLKNGLNRWVRG